MSERRRTERALIIGVTILLLTPCFWLEHIEAGDLSSHQYNAWLAGEIRDGRAQGLTIVPVWTNVLTDWGLEALGSAAGQKIAERTVAGLAVLTFFWGACFLLQRVSGHRSWVLAPLLGMLSYGITFQLGFLNFYLSTGLCLWIIGLLWKPSLRGFLYAIPLVILAFLAHAMPLAWAGCVLGYVYLFRYLGPAKAWMILLSGVAVLVLVQQGLFHFFLSTWSLSQVALGLAGADQIWLYDPKYLVLAFVLLTTFVILIRERAARGGWMADPTFHLWLLHLAAYILLPTAIQFPQYQHVLGFIPQRISLLLAISFCMLIGAASRGRGTTRLLGSIALVFFACLYVDQARFNRVEADVARLLQQTPRGESAIAIIDDDGTRMNALAHVASRACIGQCFDYANYEPVTAQFRIRILTANRVAASSMQTVQEIEQGMHEITPAEAPLYAVCACDTETSGLCLRKMEAGQKACSIARRISWRLGGSSP